MLSQSVQAALLFSTSIKLSSVLEDNRRLGCLPSITGRHAFKHPVCEARRDQLPASGQTLPGLILRVERLTAVLLAHSGLSHGGEQVSGRV